jgi:heat shock protein 1/8
MNENISTENRGKNNIGSLGGSSDYETEENIDDDLVLGIDLGTRFSCLSIWRHNRFEVISDQFGNRTIPSVVAFYRSARLTGHNALSMKEVNPKNTICDIKRLIGRKSNDPAIDLITKLVAYDIADDQSGQNGILVKLDETDPNIICRRSYRPEEICGYILAEAKRLATAYLGHPITKAVITVPAYFNDGQRQATLDSAQIAGLDVLKIINEPTAAALAYGMGSKKWKRNGEGTTGAVGNSSGTISGGNVIVYDFGAGTLDVCLMNISNGVFRALAVGGNTHLGGEDIDYLVMNRILINFKKQYKIKDLKLTKLSQVKLKNSTETAKKILSTAEKAIICVDDFYDGKKLYYVLTREYFEMICNELFIMCMKPLKDVLDSAGLTRDDIDDVILVGGSTRIPKIQQLILDFFANTSIAKLTQTLNPDEVVSAGASIYGHIMTHHNDPFSENLILLDITPLSLGVETLQKQMTTIIPRNTVIPTKKTKIFTTDTDDQDSVIIKIFEGERKLTKHNFHVGTFDLSGFEKGPRGYPVIKITFSVDINGILQVTAHEKRSSVENTIKITSTWGAKGRLSKTEIDSIILEAESNDQIDSIYSSKIGLIHKINSICSTVLINLKDESFHLTNLDKKKMRMDIKNNLSWLKNKELASLELDELQSRNDRLNKLYVPLIAQVNKTNTEFADSSTNPNVADVHGDDDDAQVLHQYEKIELHSDSSSYDKEEIKTLKKIIFDLGKNILSVINNPISNFSKEDIEFITDYIGTVNIWLYTTTASTTIEFVVKINEINKITEEIMNKYTEHKIFASNEKFSKRDELQLTCVTLNTSIKSNFFSLSETDTDKLTKLINQTTIWLLDHPNEEAEVYEKIITEINFLCNSIHHGMHKMKILESVEIINQTGSGSESDSESEPEDDPELISESAIPETASLDQESVVDGIRIVENIGSIINKLPDKPTKRNPPPKEPDVLLKLDINKLNSNHTFHFKS